MREKHDSESLSVRFKAMGHPMVLSTHPNTIEFTKESHLTSRGDCVVAVSSAFGARDLPDGLKIALARSDTAARVVLSVDHFKFVIRGRGAAGLSFSHPTDLVIRRSGFISDRTLMVHADKSAIDLPREMVRALQNPSSSVSIEISTNTRE